MLKFLINNQEFFDLKNFVNFLVHNSQRWAAQVKKLRRKRTRNCSENLAPQAFPQAQKNNCTSSATASGSVTFREV